MLDAHLRDPQYVAGDSLTIGDISLGSTVYRWLNLEIDRSSLPYLQAWHERLAARLPYREHVMVSFAIEDPA